MKIVEKRVIAERDGDDFILSDATVDRVGDVIQPSGWQLRHFKNNPVALFNHNQDAPIGTWENVRIEGGKLMGKLALAAKGTSARIDEIRELIEQGILKAVSVGFRALEYEPRGKGGIEYKKQELLEASVVSVPANPAAVMAAKSLNISDETISEVFGEPAEPDLVVSRKAGVSAEPTQPIKPEGKAMGQLAQNIQKAQDEVVSLNEALNAVAENPEATTEEVQKATDDHEAAVKHLEALQRLEKSLAARTAEDEPTNEAVPVKRVFATARPERKPGSALIRAAAVNAIAYATGKDVTQVLNERYANDEATGTIVKAAVSGATTTGAGWAAELVETEMTAFLETLRPLSVYPALSDAGGGRLNFGPGSGAIKVPSRSATPSIGGSFVGEGAPIPVRKLGLTSITLTPKKMGVISVFSREIARYSNPQIEGIIRNEVLADTALTLDTLLLDAVAGDAVRPAGLLNGVTVQTATASGGYNAILGDIRKLRAPFSTANAGRNLVLLMNPAQADALALTPGADGTLGWADSILSRYRIVVSTTVPTGRLIMIDAADFVTAAGDVPEFELSTETVLHMEDTTPKQIGSAPVGTETQGNVAYPAQSMFQTAQIAIRMLLDVSWAMRRTGMVQFIDGATW